MASSNNDAGSSTENPKGWSAPPPPPDVEYEAFLTHLANECKQSFSELKRKTGLRNDWTHEEDILFNDSLKKYFTREELDGSWADLFQKHGEDEMMRRYGEIADNYFPKTRKVDDVKLHHIWLNFKKAPSELKKSPSVNYDDFIASIFKKKPLSEMPQWLKNDWTPEEDDLLNNLLKRYWSPEDLDGSWLELFTKYGSAEVYGRYSEIAKHFKNRNKGIVSWRHRWFMFKKSHESTGKEAEPTESVGSSSS